MNRSLPFDDPHLLMSNLEPRHTYYIQVAAYNSRGAGPFSATLEVRPEPSLAHLGAVAGISEGASLKGVAWVTPLVIGFVVVIAIIATAALIYVRKANSVNNANSNKFPVNLTPVLFDGRDHVKKHSTTPTFREFQLISEGHNHANTRRERRNKKTVSIWGISSTLNRLWKGGRGHVHNGCGPRRRQSIHVSHGLTSEDDSDYGCIDRSTHSITGYLNGRNRGSGGGSRHAHHSTLSTCADSLSPYATTHVLHHHHLHHHHHHPSKRHRSHHQVE